MVVVLDARGGGMGTRQGRVRERGGGGVRVLYLHDVVEIYIIVARQGRFSKFHDSLLVISMWLFLRYFS